jgi:hypothetical protein
MREFRHLVHDIEHQLEDAVRAKQQLDTARWRDELRPCAMRLFAARTARLPWSRALVHALVDELHPDDLFTHLVGNVDRVPRRQWPQVVAVALALRYSWQRDSFAALAKRLHVSVPTHRLEEELTARSRRPSRRRFSGAPRPCQGFPLRSNPSRGSRP